MEEGNDEKFDALIDDEQYDINGHPCSLLERILRKIVFAAEHSLLETACYLENDYYAKRLLERGADPNYFFSFSPLDWACSYKATESGEENALAIVKMLLNAGADTAYSKGTWGQNVLQTTACGSMTEDTYEIASLLIEYGADKTYQDRKGKTAYDYAVEKGYTDLAELLKP